MSIQFGLYLVKRGVITAAQLVSLLESQVDRRTYIGQLALEAKWMTADEVFDVLAEQTETQECFGEIAIAKGFLTQGQLAELLLRQQRRRPSLEKLLVDCDEVVADELRRLAAEYHAAQLRREQANNGQASETWDAVRLHTALRADAAAVVH